MKRCDNCGWGNPDSLDRCEKCGNPLGEAITEEETIEQAQAEEPAPEAAPAPASAPARVSKYSATMRDTRNLADTLNEAASSVCPKCGYPIAGIADFCPNCGAKVKAAAPQPTVAINGAARPAAPARPEASPYQATVRDAGAAAATKQGAAFGKATITEFLARPFLRKATSTVETEPREPQPAARPAEQPQVYKLVPVNNASYPTIYLSEGDIVTIGNRRYKFEK